jgi:hypothetical protein
VKRKKLSTRCAEVGLAAASVLVILLLGEAIVRLTHLSEQKPTGYAPVRIRRADLLPFNSLGHRDFERTIAKPPGVRRVLSLGDSFAWGASIEFDDTYAQRIERALCRRGQRWEVIQLAGPGMNTVLQATQLATKGLAYQPDVVVLGFVLNDAEDDGAILRRRAHESAWRRARRREQFLKYSAFYRYVSHRIDCTLENRWRRRSFLELYAHDYPGWIACQDALARMSKLCHAQGIPFIVMIFPLFGDPLDDRYPFEQIHRDVAHVAELDGAKVLDLLNVYRGLRSDLLVVDGTNDEHPNEIAHRIAAKALLRELDEVLAIPDVGEAD